MKRNLLPVLFLLLSFSFVAQGQMIESFDATTSDTLWQVNFESAPSTMTVSNNTTDKVEGLASLHVDAKIGALHEWGSFAQYIYALPDGATPLDWSISDTLSIWIKVLTAPAHPEYMVFRIQIADRLTEDGDIEQYIYENLTILDGVHDWVELKVPFVEIESDGSYIPDSTGFVISPSGWGGFTYNDRTLNLNKIVQFQLGIITSGYTAGVNLPADSIIVAFDNFQRTGAKAIPLVVFNGMAIPSTLNLWSWGQSAVAVEVGAGATANTNALKWTQGNEFGNGWTGFGFDVPVTNLGGAWQQDSVKFKLKAEEGVGALRVQFEAGAGKVGTVFTPTADNQWHEYAFALREMTFQDGTTFFDSSAVDKIGMMAEASGIAGKVVYIDDWWTGNPEFDVIPPVAVQNLAVVPGTYTNLVTWSDVPGEETETYSIYYSSQPITDLAAAEVVQLNVAENLQIFEHLLRAPVTDQSVSYYYAITCTDKDGNVSEPTSLGSATSNTAKGVATVSLSTPVFNADGDLSEWAGVTPIRMYPSEGNGYVVTNTQITGDADLSVKAYLAMDADYLYFAFDIEDDVVSPDAQSDTWLNDCPDLFIGLYNWHGKPHTSYERGAEPDYHFRFTKSRGFIDGISGGDSLLTPGTEYFWGEKFPTGYSIEGRISFAELAQISGDDLFVPVEGFRLPLDYSINDADDTGTREGILTYSPFNEDQSWSSVARWSYTWIGSLWSPVGVEDEYDMPNQYNLSQNYPNPFNPSTEIRYTLENGGNVSLKVFDVLGREVASLVNQFQNAGQHSVKFDASGLSTGVYFYRIESGSYQSIKKMMLIK